MFRFISKIKKTFFGEISILKLYCILYLVGTFLGICAAILLKEQFTEQVRLLFSSENCCSFWSAYLQQAVIFVFLFFLGLTAIGIPILPLYPIYKGFSLGLLISLGIICYGFEGFFLGFPAFFIQNAYYAFLGYFICYSSARLSISLLQLIRGYGKHSATYQELIQHVYCIIAVLPLIAIGSFWESSVVPIILKLF